MTEIVNTAPKFVRVLSGEARPESKSVALLLGTADREMFGLEFDAGVAPAVIAALASLVGKATEHLPGNERPSSQALQTTGMTFGLNEHGQPGIILALEGGGEIALALTLSDLPMLKQMIDETLAAEELARKH
ncbi:hypothetical protein [Mesorhizobium sp. Z1-4]|uniref:hypothetical protein n=1 Tax=Mesorhizobium sp. Z1-4 TaxID=2448478 RepID=UPI000FDAE7D2|nr:hypothetical protein [Mesorhizobium sp. Z1-4]